MSQTLGHTKNMKISQDDDKALSIIEDAITANEQDGDTVQDENVNSDDDTKNRPKSGAAEAENVSDEGQEARSDNFQMTVLSQEEQQERLKDSILKRASALAAEEAKKSALDAKLDDVEMYHSPEKNVPKASEEGAEVHIQECSDDEVDEEELRDEADEDLFADLHKRDRDDIDEQRAEHNSVLVKLDGNIKDKENLLAAIKESQNQMQNDLISLMKEQYQHKVLELTKEITQLEK